MFSNFFLWKLFFMIAFQIDSSSPSHLSFSFTPNAHLFVHQSANYLTRIRRREKCFKSQLFVPQTRRWPLAIRLRDDYFSSREHVERNPKGRSLHSCFIIANSLENQCSIKANFIRTSVGRPLGLGYSQTSIHSAFSSWTWTKTVHVCTKERERDACWKGRCLGEVSMSTFIY